MAKLPVYTTNANIRVAKRAQVDTSGADALMRAGNNLGNTMQEVAVQWQETQNAAETLDGKNKMVAEINDIMDEAENYNDYSSPKDLQAKEKELSERLNRVVPNIAGGFTNDRNKEAFEMNNKINEMQSNEKLKAIFRRKYIDNNNANLAISLERNKKAFVESGNAVFKKSYIADLENSYKAGYISRAQKVSRAQQVEGWDKYMILRQAETDPEAVINNLKEGKYNVKPEDMNDLLKDLNTVKTNKHLMDKYEESVRQDQGESKTTDFIYGQGSYDEKLQYINNMEFSGDISGAFAVKARRAIRQFKPEAEKRISDAQSMADVLQRVYDLNESSTDSTEYLNGIRAIRQSVVDLHSDGSLTTKDAVSLNNQINTATRARIAEATSDVGYKFSEAKSYFKTALPPEYQNEAIRNMFYATQDLNLEGKSEKEIKQIYQKKAIEVSESILQESRMKASKAYTDIQTQSNDKFIKDLAAQRGRDPDTISKDIDETAKKYGLSREQVINKLRGSM